jgi:hypothetical protein
MALYRTRPDAAGRYSVIHVNAAGVFMGAWLLAGVAIAIALPIVAAIRDWLR